MTDATPRRSRIVATLSELLSPSKNPFLLMEIRREGRNWRTWASLGGVALLLSLIVCGTGWLLSNTSIGVNLMQRYNPPVGEVVFAIVSLLHLLAIGIAVATRSQMAFWFEQDRKTLPAIVIAPLTAIELVLKKSVYPGLRGILVCLAGLPVYALCFAMGGGRLLSVVFLGLLILVLLIQIPPRPPTVLTEQAHRMLHRHQQSAAAGPFIGMLGGMWGFIPMIVTNPMMRNGALNWIDWLARAATTGYAFFSFRCAPLLLVVPLIILHKTAQVFWTASFITVARELTVFSNLQDYWRALRQRTEDTSFAADRLRRVALRLWRVAAVSFLLIAIGYAWKPLIASGLAGVLFGRRGSVPHAMAALLLALIGPTLCSFAYPVWRGMPGARNRSDPQGADSGFPRDAMPIANQLFLVLGLFVLCCLLARTSPLMTDGVAFARIALVTSTSLLYKFGLHRIEQEFWRKKGRDQNSTRALGNRPFFGLALLSFPYPFLALAISNPVVNATAAISPLIAYLNITPWFGIFIEKSGLTQMGQAPPWWMSPALQIPLGLLCTAIAKWMSRHPEVRKVKPKPSRWSEETIERFVERLTRVWDNPVTTKEIRVRSRRSGVASFSSALFVFLMVWFVATIYPAETSRILDILPHPFFSRTLVGISKVSAALLLLLTVTSCVVSIVFAAGVTSFTFTSEMRKATWQGLALTPMQNWEVAVGKIMPAMVATAVVVALFSPFLLICLLIAPDLSVFFFAVVGLLWIFVQAFTVACIGALIELWYWLLKWIPVLLLILLLGAHVWFVVTSGQGVIPFSSWIREGPGILSLFTHVAICLSLLALESLIAAGTLFLVIGRVGALRTGEIVTEGAVPN